MSRRASSVHSGKPSPLICANRACRLVGSGLAVGLVAALLPWRAWPKFAANIVRVGATLARSSAAPALIALASKKYLHSVRPESRIQAE